MLQLGMPSSVVG